MVISVLLIAGWSSPVARQAHNRADVRKEEDKSSNKKVFCTRPNLLKVQYIEVGSRRVSNGLSNAYILIFLTRGGAAR